MFVVRAEHLTVFVSCCQGEKQHFFQLRRLGCQIFLGSTYQNGKNTPDNHKTCTYTKRPQNRPNGLKIDQIVIKYTDIFHLKDPPRLALIGIFRFENIPSGNPAQTNSSSGVNKH
jgi:hypothetical protein